MLVDYFVFCRLIRCWDAKSCCEVYRITVGLGGQGSGPDLCVWSLVALRYQGSLDFFLK